MFPSLVPSYMDHSRFLTLLNSNFSLHQYNPWLPQSVDNILIYSIQYSISELTVTPCKTTLSAQVVMYSCLGLYSYRVHSFQNYLSVLFLLTPFSENVSYVLIQIICLVTFSMSLSQKPRPPK